MPLQPILLTPAWRTGSQTPWGGCRLKALFDKDAPDEVAGESLELSAIPGLECRDGSGSTLSRLIEEHGKALVGTDVREPFPLLLKLLDARDRLSVQVHPGDAAAKKKHGKLGKSEAWVILDSVPGAELICGVRPGIGLEQLRRSVQDGETVEDLFLRLPVKPGDVIYIPAGTVHAIGAGIVLYEIQQSSDITYRLYDWGRVDDKGRPRELHLQDSLDAIDLSSRPQAAVPVRVSGLGGGVHERLLGTPHFVLDRFSDCHDFSINPDRRRFAVLTALQDGLLTWDDGTFELKKGRTALLPAEGYQISYSGGEALMAAPAVI